MRYASLESSLRPAPPFADDVGLDCPWPIGLLETETRIDAPLAEWCWRCGVDELSEHPTASEKLPVYNFAAWFSLTSLALCCCCCCCCTRAPPPRRMLRRVQTLSMHSLARRA